MNTIMPLGGPTMKPPAVTETATEIVISGDGYKLLISRQQPSAELQLNGRSIATLSLASGADTIDGGDEQTTLGQPEVHQESASCRVLWRGRSALWTGKEVEIEAWNAGFSYGYTLQGQGNLDRAYLLRTRQIPSLAAPELRLFNPEPNSGLVRYSGERCAPGKSCVMCYPEKSTGANGFAGAADFSTISVGRDKFFHDGNWMFNPAPFCYAVEGVDNWLALGIAADPGAWMFSDMEYPGAGFGFSLVYDGHVTVDGAWRSPSLLCLTAADEYAAIERYCDTLRASGLVPAHGRGQPQDWWREPMFCGWGEQVSQQEHAGSAAPAADWATQANYERWLATLTEHGIEPGTVVIDDKWQRSYGRNDVDTAKWPDLAGFIARQHTRNRHVLLWLHAWSPEGLPATECMVDGAGLPLAVDPGAPAFRARFTAEVRYLLQDIGADGFKIDFTHVIPRGRQPQSAGALWGLELMRQWLDLLSEAARGAKPDALLIAHTANPYLADLVDMLRLNDIAGLTDPEASVLPDMRHRARVARIASPFWLLDADNWPCSSRQQWRDYVRAQADGSLGVPSLYHAERLGWGPTDEPLTEEDYATVRNSWLTYRKAMSQK